MVTGGEIRAEQERQERLALRLDEMATASKDRTGFGRVCRIDPGELAGAQIQHGPRAKFGINGKDAKDNGFVITLEKEPRLVAGDPGPKDASVVKDAKAWVKKNLVQLLKFWDNPDNFEDTDAFLKSLKPL